MTPAAWICLIAVSLAESGCSDEVPGATNTDAGDTLMIDEADTLGTTGTEPDGAIEWEDRLPPCKGISDWAYDPPDVPIIVACIAPPEDPEVSKGYISDIHVDESFTVQNHGIGGISRCIGETRWQPAIASIGPWVENPEFKWWELIDDEGNIYIIELAGQMADINISPELPIVMNADYTNRAEFGSGMVLSLAQEEQTLFWLESNAKLFGIPNENSTFRIQDAESFCEIRDSCGAKFEKRYPIFRTILGSAEIVSGRPQSVGRREFYGEILANTWHPVTSCNIEDYHPSDLRTAVMRTKSP